MAKSKNHDEKYCSNHHKLSPFEPTNPPKHPRRRKKRAHLSHTNDWENTLCPVCLDFPHNSVLLLCSSHDKGCRPYICSTSRRHSNCLKQYRKASPDLPCPLCRGEVKGWAVVGPARRHLDGKRRSCTKDGCPFLGNYRELRRHAKTEHPQARPWDVDPARAARWERLESDRAIEDVISTIRSTMPGTVIVGDYVIERNQGSGLGLVSGTLYGDSRRGSLRGLVEGR